MATPAAGNGRHRQGGEWSCVASSTTLTGAATPCAGATASGAGIATVVTHCSGKRPSQHGRCGQALRRASAVRFTGPTSSIGPCHRVEPLPTYFRFGRPAWAMGHDKHRDRGRPTGLPIPTAQEPDRTWGPVGWGAGPMRQ